MEPCPLQHNICPHWAAARCQNLHPPCYLGAAPVPGRGRHDMAGSCWQLRSASAGPWEPLCRAPAQLTAGLSRCRAQGRPGTPTCGLWDPPAAETQQRGFRTLAAMWASGVMGVHLCSCLSFLSDFPSLTISSSPRSVSPSAPAAPQETSPTLPIFARWHVGRYTCPVCLSSALHHGASTFVRSSF